MTRVGASRIFFDVVAKWQSDKLIADMKTSQTIMQAVMLDVFDAVLGPMGDIGTMIDSMVNQTLDLAMEMGEARIAFEKFVSVDNRIALDSMNESLIEMGHNFAMTASETFDAAARMAQMGAVIGETNILIGTKMGIMFSLISGMDTESAMRRLTNLQQQTGFMYGTYSKETFKALNAMEQKKVLEEASIKTLDSLNTVENRSIATMEQLTFTMNQFASQAKLTGSSIEDMAAMSAVMIESGEQAGAAGRSLKMMYARLGGDIGGASTKLLAYGIDTKLANGDMKDMMSIMKELKEKGWDQTTSANKQAIAQTIAGNRHYVRFIKLMEGYDRAVQLSGEAADGFAGAQEEVNRRLEDPVVILEKLNAEIEDYGAKIGTSLLPGITAAATAQRDYNAELLNFTSGEYGKGFERIANSLVQFREMTKITGGFLQLQLTIRAIVIGMGAFRSVMAAIAGKQIAIDSAFGSTRSTIQAANMSLSEQKDIMKQIKGYNDSITAINAQIKGQQHAINQATYQQKLTASEVADIHEQDYYQTWLYGAETKAQFNRDKLRGNLLKNIGDELKNHALEGLKEKTAMTERNVLLAKYGSEKTGINLKERDSLRIGHQQLLTRHAIIETAIAEHSFKSEAARMNWNMAKTESKHLGSKKMLMTDELKKLQKIYRQHDATRVTLIEQRKHIVGSIIDYDSKIQKLNIYRLTEEEITRTLSKANKILNKKGNVTAKVQMLEAELLKVNIKVNAEELKRIALLEKRTAREHGLSQAMKKVVDAGIKQEWQMQRGNRTLGIGKMAAQGFSGGLMGISMLAPMVIGGQKGMRISMVATTLSMLPMIATMAKATAAMALETAMAIGLTGALAGLAAVSGVLLAVAAVYFMADWVMGTDDATAATLDFTNELLSMESVLNRLKGGQSYMLFEGAEENLAASLGLANISVDELKKSLPDTLKAIEEMQSAMKTKMTATDKGMMMENLKELEAIRDAHLTSSGQAAGYNTGLVMADSMAEGFGKLVGDEDYKAYAALMKSTDWLSTVTPEWMKNEPDVEPYWAQVDTLMTAGSEDAIANNRRILGEFEELFKQGATGAGLRKKYMAEMEMAQIKGDKDAESAAKTMIVALAMLTDGYAKVGDTLGTHSRPLERYEEILDGGAEGAIASANAILMVSDAAEEVDGGLKVLSDDFTNLTEEMNAFGSAKDELFFGGKWGNVTGSLYKQVVTQGVGTLYNKQEVIMTNNFNGFFNEEEAANKIISVLNKHMETLGS